MLNSFGLYFSRLPVDYFSQLRVERMFYWAPELIEFSQEAKLRRADVVDIRKKFFLKICISHRSLLAFKDANLTSQPLLRKLIK